MTPINLLFAADRKLRDAATDYSAEGFDEHEIRRREDALRQAARDYAAVADAKAQSSAARLAELRESIERGDGLDGALVRLRDRGVSLVTDQLRPDQGIERAVAAVLSWRATEAVARAASDAVDLLADDALEGAALLCLDRLPTRQAEGPGVPLASRVRVADGPGTVQAYADGAYAVGLADGRRLEGLAEDALSAV